MLKLKASKSGEEAAIVSSVRRQSAHSWLSGSRSRRWYTVQRQTRSVVLNLYSPVNTVWGYRQLDVIECLRSRNPTKAIKPRDTSIVEMLQAVLQTRRPLLTPLVVVSLDFADPFLNHLQNASVLVEHPAHAVVLRFFPAQHLQRISELFLRQGSLNCHDIAMIDRLLHIACSDEFHGVANGTNSKPSSVGISDVGIRFSRNRGNIDRSGIGTDDGALLQLDGAEALKNSGRERLLNCRRCNGTSTSKPFHHSSRLGVPELMPEEAAWATAPVFRLA